MDQRIVKNKCTLTVFLIPCLHHAPNYLPPKRTVCALLPLCSPSFSLSADWTIPAAREGGEVDGCSIPVIICERMGLVTRGQMLLLSGIKSPGDGVMGGGKGRGGGESEREGKKETFTVKQFDAKEGQKGTFSLSLSIFSLFFKFLFAWYIITCNMKLNCIIAPSGTAASTH